LLHNSCLEGPRTVVIFRCDWYNQAGKTKGIRDDGHFKSINVMSLWYKTDPYILSSQSKKIFFLQDTAFGKDWPVVQKFEHRDMYDVAEKTRAVMMFIRMTIVLILSMWCNKVVILRLCTTFKVEKPL
jgi:hypothetical protein